MSILQTLSGLKKSTSTSAKVAMTPEQVEQCKEAIRAKNRGYNVQPNKFDVSKPYRVAINYDNEWTNFGDFVSVDVAAAIGGLVAKAYFGENGRVGDFDAEKAEASPELAAWLADKRNAVIIAQAEGKATGVHAAKTKGLASPSNNQEPNPF